ncbi:MAG: hypothetical protein H6Q13_3400, partial [Bacteroidetes bacterium]|nr:hypothetical protein [Bacteroidota bacterium]
WNYSCKIYNAFSLLPDLHLKERIYKDTTPKQAGSGGEVRLLFVVNKWCFIPSIYKVMTSKKGVIKQDKAKSVRVNTLK